MELISTCTTHQHLNTEGIHHIYLLYVGNLHFMQMTDRHFQNHNLPPVIQNELYNDNKDKTYNGNFISASDFVKKVTPPTIFHSL